MRPLQAAVRLQDLAPLTVWEGRGTWRARVGARLQSGKSCLDETEVVMH